MNSDNSNTNQPICAASASSSNKPSTVGQRFIDYWDNVVRQWINLPMGKGHNASANNKYKDSNLVVSIENEQLPFFTDKILKDKLCPAHLPEPYWGDPDNCSIVIINYNPGGGTDMSPHTYKFTNGSPYFLPFPPNTMIEYVNCYSYSSLAKDFPIWKKNLPPDRMWLMSYGGRDWWLAKKKWIGHIVAEASVGKTEPNHLIEECPPFAIEFCGWHSAKWPDLRLDTAKDAVLIDSIKKHFAEPLIYAIEQSKSRLAVCIGAQFSPALFNSLSIPFVNITCCVYCQFTQNYGNQGVSFPCGISLSTSNNSSSIEVSVKDKKKEVKRYYRIYDIKSSFDNHHIIINTFAPGSNNQPAEHFFDFEAKLIATLKRMNLI